MEMVNTEEGKKKSIVKMFFEIAGFTFCLMLILFKPQCA